MSDATTWPWPAGYTVLRQLSEGKGGIVALARKSDGELAALKLLRLAADIPPEKALQRHQRLVQITGNTGLLRICDCGLTVDHAWLWEELELADDLDGGPAGANDDYQPATLRAELIERGPCSTEAVLSIGLSLCNALNALHSAGLVHRDVKPGNLFRVRGQAVLGDYGLTAPPGAPFDFTGTEGFVPSEGTADAAADLFALGKTLYELWTGCDRLEFPTLPKRILDNADWPKRGTALNELLLRVCSPQPGERYRSAHKLAAELQAILSGKTRRITRRQWLAVAGGTAVALGGVSVGLWIAHRPPVARWRQRKAWNNVPVEWGEQMPLFDAQRNCLFHLQCRHGESMLGRLDLDSYEYRKLPIQEVTENPFAPVLHPTERTIWFAESGLGPVWRLDPDTGEFTRLPGGELPEADAARSFYSLAYWNPITHRLGSFGGYGWLATRNWRWEFDAAESKWLNAEPDQPGREPRCRHGGRLMPMGNGRRLLLFGGGGSLSGKQDDREPGLPLFDGRFHRLGDLWRLDLSTNQWTCLIAAPGLALPHPWSACYLEKLGTVVVMQGHAPSAPFGTPADVFIHRLGRDRGFVQIASGGDVPDGAGQGYLTAVNSGRTLLAFQKAGIFEVTLEG